jgi:hypothetical protein
MPPRKPKSPKPLTPKTPKPWDLPTPLNNGDDTAEPLFTAVGRALSNWEHVENQLANLFVVLVGAKVTRDMPAPAARAYGTILSFQSRLAMLEAAARAFFLSHPKIGEEQKLWSDLSKQLDGFSSRRNDIAHGSVEARSRNHAWVLLDAGAIRFEKVPHWGAPAYRLTAEQVSSFAKQFAELADSVHYLRYVIQAKRRTSRRKPLLPRASPPQFPTHITKQQTGLQSK